MRALYTAILALLLATPTQAQDATEIVEKAHNKFRGESSMSEMTMTIVRPGWTRELSMRSWSLGDSFALVLVLAPARDKGVAYLKRYKEVWNWQPRIQRTIKLPPSMMSQSWMGSDFTNDDLVRESSVVEDYTHTLLGEETIDGHVCYKVELTPKPGAAVVWGKVIQWIDKNDYWLLRTEQYDESGVLVNTMTAGNLTNLGGRKLPARMEMVPADHPNQKTVITYQSIDFNPNLSPSFFTIRQMKRLKP